MSEQEERLKAWALELHTALDGKCESTVSLGGGDKVTVVGRDAAMEVELTFDSSTTSAADAAALVLSELEATAAPG